MESSHIETVQNQSKVPKKSKKWGLKLRGVLGGRQMEGLKGHERRKKKEKGSSQALLRSQNEYKNQIFIFEQSQEYFLSGCLG